MRTSPLFFALLILIAGLRLVQAAPPTNDVCSGAENVPLNAALPYLTAITDISQATTNGDPPTPSCIFGDVSRSIWYKFTPKSNDFYTISSCANAPTATTVPDTVMAIYTSSGSCPATNELPSTATSVGCDDDSCGPGFTQAAITTQLQAGTAYYIVVWQSGTAPPSPGHSSVQLLISKPGPPGNDTVAGASEVFLNQPVIGTTVFAQDDYELPFVVPCAGPGQMASSAAGRDVVYAFTAPADGDYSIKADHYKNISGYDLVLYAAGSLPSGPPPVVLTDCLAFASRNPFNSAEEIFCLSLTNQQRIYVVVDEDTSSPQGSSFSLEVTRCLQETEPNNSWTNANVPVFGIEGSIRPVNDVDFYALGAFPAGSRVFAMIDGSAAYIDDFQMRVVALPGGSPTTLEFDDGNNDDPFGAFSSNVAGTPLTDAPAFLRINNLFGVAAEPYRLYAVVQPPLAAATLETEPNDTLAQASTGDKNYFYGSLTSAVPDEVSSDVDVYAFSVKGAGGVSDLIFLSLDCDPLRNNTPINGKLELLDASGNVLVTVDDQPATDSSTTLTAGSARATTPFSPGEAIIYRTMAAGTYYARVSISPNANMLNGAGDYLLSISQNGFLGSCGCNMPPTLANLVLPASVYQNAPFTLSGSILDYDLAQSHQVVINWGDGSSITTTNLPPGANTFNLAHLYVKSSSNVALSLTVQDSGAASAATNLNLTVLPQPVSPSFLSLTQSDLGHAILQLQGSPGVTYQVQASVDLLVWTNLAGATADGTGLFSVEDPAWPVPVQRFYRAIWP